MPRKHKVLRIRGLFSAVVVVKIIRAFFWSKKKYICKYFYPEILLPKTYPKKNIKSVHKDVTQNMFPIVVFVKEKCLNTKCQQHLTNG